MPDVATMVHIIDDDEAVRESLEALLMVSGFEVETYSSAEEYIARADDGDGCIVLDINMPGVGGLDLLRVLRSRKPALAVVVLTASQTPRLEEQVLELGASAFLTKPVREAALVESLRAAQTGR
jgi:two-component system response regulator FixJ